MAFPQSSWRCFKSSINSFISDDVLTLAAALSFYTALSFAPLLTLSLWAASTMGATTQQALIGQIAAIAGPQAQTVAAAVISNINQRPAASGLVGGVGLLIILFGASTVFAQLQSSLNTIWKVDVPASNELLQWVRRRLITLGLLGAILFVLAVSLVVTAALGMLTPGSSARWALLNELVSVIVLTGLFAALFRFLPDIRLRWRSTLAGALATSTLFILGKVAIGQYLTHFDVGVAYGAAGSIVVFLAWVYYSSAIFLYGAELIKAYGGLPQANHSPDALLETQQQL